MWDLPGPGLEPVSPALAGGLLTTAPPGKPQNFLLHVLLVGGFHVFECVRVNIAFLKTVFSNHSLLGIWKYSLFLYHIQ